MQKITGNKHLNEVKNEHNLIMVLFYKITSDNSLEVQDILGEMEEKHSDLKIYKVKVGEVRDIHNHYNIHEVPTLLVFRKGQPAEIIKGKQTLDFYEELLNEIEVSYDSESESSAQEVTVYTTPTCQYCDAVKEFLENKGVDYDEIDVSADQEAAQELMDETGQKGVPQTEIDGQFVVGFDTDQLESLLNI